MSSFGDRLAAAVRERATAVLVGLDPHEDRLPPGLASPEADSAGRAAASERFCCDVIDVVASRVPAVKPQVAFFERWGPAGMNALATVVSYARQKGLLVILDGKRNDIGSTAAAYARGYLGPPGQSAWGADAVTVNPYLGDDSLTPFVEVACQRQAGVFVLVKTSNPGGRMLQDLTAQGEPIYRHVARHVERLAQQTAGRSGYGAVGAVVGATYPQQLAELRTAMPHTWFLVPGFGAQGAGAADVAGAFDPQGTGALINSSRGILFAYRREPYRQRFGPGRWQEAVEAATGEMIESLRAETPAGRLAGWPDSTGSNPHA